MLPAQHGPTKPARLTLGVHSLALPARDLYHRGAGSKHDGPDGGAGPHWAAGDGPSRPGRRLGRPGAHTAHWTGHDARSGSGGRGGSPTAAGGGSGRLPVGAGAGGHPHRLDGERWLNLLAKAVTGWNSALTARLRTCMLRPALALAACMPLAPPLPGPPQPYHRARPLLRATCAHLLVVVLYGFAARGGRRCVQHSPAGTGLSGGLGAPHVQRPCHGASRNRSGGVQLHCPGTAACCRALGMLLQVH